MAKLKKFPRRQEPQVKFLMQLHITCLILVKVTEYLSLLGLLAITVGPLKKVYKGHCSAKVNSGGEGTLTQNIILIIQNHPVQNVI